MSVGANSTWAWNWLFPTDAIQRAAKFNEPVIRIWKYSELILAGVSSSATNNFFHLQKTIMQCKECLNQIKSGG